MISYVHVGIGIEEHPFIITFLFLYTDQSNSSTVFLNCFSLIKPFIEKHLTSGGDKSTAIETAMKNFKEQEPQELPRQFKDPKREVMVSKHGKTIVIDKEKEQEYLANGWKLAESIKESRTKIVEAIKSRTDGHAQDIAGIEGDTDRVTGEAGLQIARIKYLSNY